MAALAFGAPDPVNSTNQPFRILNISSRGDVRTFCPELVTARTPDGRPLAMGNVLDDGPLEAMLDNPVFIEVARQVAAGVWLCKDTCDY
jgi:uncharacterized protein